MGRGFCYFFFKAEKGHTTARKGTDDNYLISWLLPSKPGIVVVLSNDFVDKIRRMNQQELANIFLSN